MAMRSRPNFELAKTQGSLSMNFSKLKRTGLGIAASLGALALTTAPALAAAPKIDSGDTAWMLTSSALVLLMTIPGLALFYAGMVRKKNILATAAQSFGATCIITVLWMIIG
jgi:Amt family ammonium transporter